MMEDFSEIITMEGELTREKIEQMAAMVGCDVEHMAEMMEELRVDRELANDSGLRLGRI